MTTSENERLGQSRSGAPVEAFVAGMPPGSAVGSLVLGVVGVLTSFAVLPGLVCGVGAVLLAKHAAERTGVDSGRPGRGYAVAGQAAGGAALVLSALFGAWFAAEMLGTRRGPSRRMANSTQLRGIHQGMFTYANSNKGHFPGLDSKGNIIPNSAEHTGNSGDGDTVQARVWMLLEGNFFTPDYAISPSENDPRVTEYDPHLDASRYPVVIDNQTLHYSYALLSINGQPGQPPDSEGRAAEWTQSTNTQAVVASDRNTGTSASMSGVQSIHTSSPGDWKGSILWNDNHVAFEQTHIVETRYGMGTRHDDPPQHLADNLFEPAGDDDAYLIHQGD